MMANRAMKAVALFALITLTGACVVDQGDYTLDTPPDGTINIGDESVTREGDSEPWGYESLLYDVLMARDDTSFSGWVDNVNRDVITFWSLYYEDHGSLYATAAVPANQSVRHYEDGGISCGSDYMDNDNSLYCRTEDWVGIDLIDYRRMVDMFGPSVLMWVLSHEWGHAQQSYMTFDHRMMSQTDRERQADCFSGAYVRAKLGAHISVGLSGHLASGGAEVEPPISPADIDGINAFLDWLAVERDIGFDRRAEFSNGYNGGVQACLDPGYVGSAGQGSPDGSNGQSGTGSTPDVIMQTAELGAGFTPDPFVLSGVLAGGAIELFDFGDSCVGLGPDEPHLELYWSGGGEFLRFYFEAVGDNDATMVVFTPTGSTVCSDDSFDTLNPTVDVVPEVGYYVVVVGSYSSERFEGTLYVTEIPEYHP